jgi:hypothetical protein
MLYRPTFAKPSPAGAEIVIWRDECVAHWATSKGKIHKATVSLRDTFLLDAVAKSVGERMAPLIRFFDGCHSPNLKIGDRVVTYFGLILA